MNERWWATERSRQRQKEVPVARCSERGRRAVHVHTEAKHWHTAVVMINSTTINAVFKKGFHESCKLWHVKWEKNDDNMFYSLAQSRSGNTQCTPRNNLSHRKPLNVLWSGSPAKKDEQNKWHAITPSECVHRRLVVGWTEHTEHRCTILSHMFSLTTTSPLRGLKVTHFGRHKTTHGYVPREQQDHRHRSLIRLLKKHRNIQTCSLVIPPSPSPPSSHTLLPWQHLFMCGLSAQICADKTHIE